jgi:GPH family glycoside/pentoside/hexuronide:cation symporter
MEAPRIGAAERAGFGLFSVSCNIVTSFVNTFILFFYTNVLGISPVIGGMVVSIGVAWDAVNDPLIASYADNHTFKNGERIRPYALYAPLPLAAVTVLMFTAPALPYAGKVAYAIAAYLLFTTLTTFLRLPSYAMPQLATGDDRQRLMLNTYVSGGASLGAVLASVICWPLVRLFAGVDEKGNLIRSQRGFLLGAAVIGAVVVFGALFQYFTTAERVRPKNTEQERLSILASFKMLLKNSNFCWNCGFAILYFVNNTLITSTIIYYCSYVLMDSGKTTLLMAVFALGSIVMLPFVKPLDRKLGRRGGMIVGGALILVSKIPFIIAPHQLVAMLACVFLTGLSVTLNIVMFSTTRADIADLVEFEHGRRIDSMVINLMGFLDKCGTALTSLLIGVVLQAAGYDSVLATQPPAAVSAIIGLIGWAGAIAAAGMVLCARRITVTERVAEMKAAQSSKGGTHNA